MWFSHQNTEERHFMMLEGLKLDKFWDSYVNGRASTSLKKKFVLIMYICQLRFRQNIPSLEKYDSWRAKASNNFLKKRFKYQNRSFWYRGYYVDKVGKNTKKIKEYIRNQLVEDKEIDRLAMDFEDLLAGFKVEKWKPRNKWTDSWSTRTT